MRTHAVLAALLLAGLAAAAPAQAPVPLPAPSGKPADGVLRLERRRGPKPPAPVPPAGGGAAPQAAVAEVELNNSVARADDLGTQADFDGSLLTLRDQDVVRFVLPQDADVTLSMTAAGASPVPDPDLLVTDAAGQFVAYNDDENRSNLYPRIRTPLPAGAYHLVVASVAGVGSYRASVGWSPVTVATVPHNQTVNGVLAAGRPLLYRLVLTAESRVTVTANGGPLDLVLEVLRPNGTVYRQVDDAVGANPGFDSHLPPGTWYLRLREQNGAPGGFSFQANVNAQAMPAVPCGSQAVGALASDATLVVYRLALASAATVRLETRPGTTGPVSDTVLALHDRNLNTIFEQDDDNFSLYSVLSVPLPPATYYVTVRQYLRAGGGSFQLVATCNGPYVRSAATYGRNAGNLATGSDTAAFRLDVGTLAPVEFLADTATTSLDDPVLAVIDENGGLLLANDQDAVLAPDSFGGRELSRGCYSVLVREYANRPGTFDLRIGTRAFFTDAVSARTLNFNEKAGRGVAMLAAANVLPAPLPLPQPIQGLLWLDLSVWVPLPAVVVPPSGVFVAPTPNFNLFPTIKLQGLSFVIANNDFVMTDVVR
jgi:hypothetical protein